MLPTARLNRSGFTLIEVLIAMVICMIGMLALANVALMAIDTNMDNLLRDEAVRIADDLMNGQVVDSLGNAILPSGNTGPGIRNLANAQLIGLSGPVQQPRTVLRDVKGLQRTFTVTYQITTLAGTANVFQARVWVGWNYKGGSPAGHVTGQNKELAISTMLTVPN